MKTSERGSELWDGSKSKPDDFHVVEVWAHDGGSTDRLPADSALARKATQDYESSSGSFARAASDTGKDIATQMAGGFGLGWVRDYRLPFGNG